MPKPTSLGFPINHNHIDIFCRKFTETEERRAVEGTTQHTWKSAHPYTRMSQFPIGLLGDNWLAVLSARHSGTGFRQTCYGFLIELANQVRQSFDERGRRQSPRIETHGHLLLDAKLASEGFYRKRGTKNLPPLRTFRPATHDMDSERTYNEARPDLPCHCSAWFFIFGPSSSKARHESIYPVKLAAAPRP